ncbi:MAG: hypothetical protein ACE5H2_00400 [Terriglobia bacterium]
MGEGLKREFSFSPVPTGYKQVGVQQVGEIPLGGADGELGTMPVMVPQVELQTRPTFMHAFLTNLPTAIAGSLSGPEGGVAAGFARGFGAVQQQQLIRRQQEAQRRSEERAFGLREREVAAEEERTRLLGRPKPPKQPTSFQGLAAKLFQQGRTDEAREVLDFFRAGDEQKYFTRMSGRDLVFLDRATGGEIKRISNFEPLSPAERRAAAQAGRQGEVNALAGAYLVQAGNDVRQAMQLALKEARTDPHVRRNLPLILRAVKAGKLDTALEDLLRFLEAGRQDQNQE